MNNTHNIASVIITRIMYAISKFYLFASNSMSFFNEKRPHSLVNEGVASNLRDPHTLYNNFLELEKEIVENRDYGKIYTFEMPFGTFTITYKRA